MWLVVSSSRCRTCVEASYRAACRTRSSAEFCSTIEIVEEKADESTYSIELLIDAISFSRTDCEFDQ